MSIQDQFPRRMSRAAPVAAAPSDGGAADGTAAQPDAVPVPATWTALLLAVAPVPLALAAAFAPALVARLAAPVAVVVLAGLAAPLALTAVLIPFRGSFPNTDAALALVLVVVAVAAAGYRIAGVLAAVSAAVWFDFFLTVPYERFTITRHTDIETTALILAVGIAVTEIAVRRRHQHTAAARRAGYLDGINAAARAVATGTDPQLLVGQVCGQLTRLLGLSACRFQAGAALASARLTSPR